MSRVGSVFALPALLMALGATGPGTEMPSGDERHHTVRRGDTLWSIAADTIGDPRLWPALYRANRDQIADPAVLYPGQRLAIPHVDPATAEELRREAEGATFAPIVPKSAP